MILVDTSIWVDHLRSGDEGLSDLLERSNVLVHPFVVGELALGHLRNRSLILSSLSDLPQAIVATDGEVLELIDRAALSGLGIGYIDAHLLTSTRLTPDARLWTRDRRLAAVAEQLRLSPG